MWPNDCTLNSSLNNLSFSFTMVKKRTKNARRRRKRGQVNDFSGRRRVEAPAASSSVVSNAIRPLEKVRIRHREFLTDVEQFAPGVLERTQVAWNPGLHSAAPWLSSLAHAFEKYRIHSFAIEYIPAVPTIQAGMVAICPDYDALDKNAELPKSQLLSFADAARGPVWGTFTSTLRSSRFPRESLYIRHGSVPFGADLKTYDAFSFVIMHTSTPASLLGEVWITYDIELMIPQHSRDEVQGALFGMAAPPAPNQPWLNPGQAFNDVNVIIDPAYPGHNAGTTMVMGCDAGTYLIEQDGACVGPTHIAVPVLQNSVVGDSIEVIRSVYNSAAGIWNYVWRFTKAAVSNTARVADLLIHWNGLTATSLGVSNLRVLEASPEIFTP